MGYGDDQKNPYRVFDDDYEPPVYETEEKKPELVGRPVLKDPGDIGLKDRGTIGSWLYLAVAIIIAAFIITAGLNPGIIGLAGGSDDEEDEDTGSEAIVLDVPELISPSEGELLTNASIELMWSPVLNADDYHVEVWVDSSSYHANITSTSCRFEILDTLDDATYCWKVRAVNGTTYGNWSLTGTFMIRTSVATPTIASPEEDMMIFNDTISFSWSSGEDSDIYRIQVSDSSEFDSVMIDIMTSNGSLTVTLDLTENETYYWRVMAGWDNIWSDWSDNASFTRGFDAYTVTHEWGFEDDTSTWSYTFEISGEDYYNYRQLVRLDFTIASYSKYITEDDPTIIDIAAYLNEQADQKGYSDHQTIWFALNFVQCIGYEYDIDSTGLREYARYPIETLNDSTGDCEDLAALYVSLVRAMGYDAVMVHLDGPTTDHVIAAVASVTMPAESDYIMYEGVDYYYCETTSYGWVPGELPPAVSSWPAVVIP